MSGPLNEMMADVRRGIDAQLDHMIAIDLARDIARTGITAGEVADVVRR
jgi:hypothetical protein